MRTDRRLLAASTAGPYGEGTAHSRPLHGQRPFPVFALPILARMRMEEEDGLQLKDALTAVLKENLFGLELDAAMRTDCGLQSRAGWHGGWQASTIALPELNLACCGIGPNATKDQWIKLGEEIAARAECRQTSTSLATEDSSALGAGKTNDGVFCTSFSRKLRFLAL